MKSPIAREIQNLAKSGSSDLEIIEHLLDTDGLTKPANPKSKDKENYIKFKKQEVMYAATPPPIKWVLRTDSRETLKPLKQIKRSNGTEKDNDERIPIKGNKENMNTGKKTIKTADNKFQ